MGNVSGINQKIQDYLVNNYDKCKGKTAEDILLMMQEDNIDLSDAEIKELEENSFFETGKYTVKNDTIKLSGQKQTSETDSFTERQQAVLANLKKSKSENGLIGSLWSGIKNLTGIGASSDKVEKALKEESALIGQLEGPNKEIAFEKLTGMKYSKENHDKLLSGEISLKSEQALNEYKEGQEMAVDITGDIISGLSSMLIYTTSVALSPVTGGTSLIWGFATATASGAFVKSTVKFIDAKIGGREYDSFGRDLVTGAFSGALAPITGGIGGAAGRAVAGRIGIQAVKQVGKEVAEEGVKSGFRQGVKSILTNPTGYEYIGGSFAKKAMAYGTEMAVDGALGGGVDSAFRTAYDGGSAEEVADAAIQGTIGGMFLAPIIGGGIKVAGHQVGKVSKRVSDNYDKAKAASKNNPVIENPDIEVAAALGQVFKDAESLIGSTKSKGTNILNGLDGSIQQVADEISAILQESLVMNTGVKNLAKENKEIINDILMDIAAGKNVSAKTAKFMEKGVSINESLNKRLNNVIEEIESVIKKAIEKNDDLRIKVEEGVDLGHEVISGAGEIAENTLTQLKKLPDTNAYKLLGNIPDRFKSSIKGLSDEAAELDKRIQSAKNKIAAGNKEEGLRELQGCYDELEKFNTKLDKQLTDMQSSAARAGLDESIAILSERLEKVKGMEAFATMTREQRIQAITENSNILFAKFAQTFSSDKSLPKEITDVLKQFTSNCTVSRNMGQAQALANEMYGTGKYTLVKSFGAGTIGETYLAKTADGKEVVIKMLKEGVTPEKFAQDRAMFTKYIDEFTTDAVEKEYKTNLINSMFDAWDRELNFGLEAQGAKDMANGAERFRVAQTLEIGTRNGRNVSLVMEKAPGLPLDKLLRMMKLYKENPAEYMTKYADEISEFPALKNPDSWMGDLGVAYQKAQNEQSMFVNTSGTRTIHADPHAGNIFIDLKTGKPEIVYIDTGNVITRTNKETLQDLGLSMNMMFGNSRGIADAMLDGATLPAGASKEKIAEKFTKMLDEKLFKANVNIKNTQYTQTTINQIMKELNIIPNSNNSNLMKATLQRVETARAIKDICGINGNDKILNIQDMGKALIKAFKTNPREAWNTIKPILQWALKNKDQAMVTFFQMIIKNTEVQAQKV